MGRVETVLHTQPEGLLWGGTVSSQASERISLPLASSILTHGFTI